MARKDKGLIIESFKNLTERMIGADKDIILEAVYQQTIEPCAPLTCDQA